VTSLQSAIHIPQSTIPRRVVCAAEMGYHFLRASEI
jgi:hypothetical protein